MVGRQSIASPGLHPLEPLAKPRSIVTYFLEKILGKYETIMWAVDPNQVFGSFNILKIYSHHRTNVL